MTTEHAGACVDAEPKPELVVNWGDRTVAGALNGFITHAATGFVGGARLDIATAYFNVGGYELLADSLDLLTGTRVLLGAEPTSMENLVAGWVWSLSNLNVWLAHA